MNAKDLIRRAESLENDRSNFKNEWQEIANYFRPIKSDITITKAEGDKSNFKKLFESSPINSVHELKSIIVGTLFNRAIKPIQIESEIEEINENDNVRDWISEFTKVLLNQLFNSKSNFERAFSEATADDIVFGTMLTLIEEGKNHPLKYTTINIKNFLIAENEENVVDYVIIKDKKTARQIMDKWGNNKEANISDKIRKAAEKEPFKVFDLQLHIMPRKERERNKIDLLNKEIAGYWVDVNNTLIIEELGWDNLPFAVGRSEKASNEVYGTSRCMMALADARQINEMSKQINEATEIILKPSLVVNTAFKNRISLRAGALNYIEDKRELAPGQRAIEQIGNIGNIPINENLLARKQENIKEIFFLDKLKVFDDARATATQIMEIRAESLRIMGDFIFSNIDYLDQLLNVSFDILFKKIYFQNENGQYVLLQNNGLFQKELPKELISNPSLKIRYQNPITQSQRMNEAVAIEKLVSYAVNIAQSNPEILDVLDFDEIVRTYSDILNVDPDLIKNPVVVEQIRQLRQQQMQMQQQLDQEQQAIQAAAIGRKSEII